MNEMRAACRGGLRGGSPGNDGAACGRARFYHGEVRETRRLTEQFLNCRITWRTLARVGQQNPSLWPSVVLGLLRVKSLLAAVPRQSLPR
jgi:hypothetical protein